MKILKKLISGLILIFGYSCNANEAIKVACVGDSITEGPGRKHPDSYPMQLQKILGEEYKVRNFGVSSTTLLKDGDNPYWLEPQFQLVKKYHPEILIIKLGTNDSKPQNWKHKDAFIADYIDMITTFKAEMPENGTVFLCLPAPVVKDNYGIREYIIADEMIPMIKEVAQKTGVKLIDLHAPLKKATRLFPDGVHPDKEGAGRIAKIVMENIVMLSNPYIME